MTSETREPESLEDLVRLGECVVEPLENHIHVSGLVYPRSMDLDGAPADQRASDVHGVKCLMQDRCDLGNQPRMGHSVLWHPRRKEHLELHPETAERRVRERHLVCEVRERCADLICSEPARWSIALTYPGRVARVNRIRQCFIAYRRPHQAQRHAMTRRGFPNTQSPWKSLQRPFMNRHQQQAMILGYSRS